MIDNDNSGMVKPVRNETMVNSRGHLAKVEEYDPATMVLRTLTPDMKPTPEQIAELEEAEKYPAVYEDDCPELSPALIKAFKKAADERDEQLRNR